jgi:hypothetical protein
MTKFGVDAHGASSKKRRSTAPCPLGDDRPAPFPSEALSVLPSSIPTTALCIGFIRLLCAPSPATAAPRVYTLSNIAVNIALVTLKRFELGLILGSLKLNASCGRIYWLQPRRRSPYFEWETFVGVFQLFRHADLDALGLFRSGPQILFHLPNKLPNSEPKEK